VKYLSPTALTMALTWVTPLDQYLGPVSGSHGWRIRWIRIDPVSPNVQGLVISVHEDLLSCDPSYLDLTDRPELAPLALPAPTTVTSRFDTSSGLPATSVEHAALLRAEHDAHAVPDRWVNRAVDGWHYLCRLRGHEG
jgi:hypothetical protein